MRSGKSAENIRPRVRNRSHYFRQLWADVHSLYEIAIGRPRVYRPNVLPNPIFYKQAFSFLKEGILLLLMRRKRTTLLRYKPTYNEDGLFTNHNCDFIDDPLFKEAYELGFSTGSSKGWHARWRVYTACWLADRATRMDGDFVECGTNKGLTARAIAHYTNFGSLDKKFYLVDTFSGLVPEYESESERQRENPAHLYEECFEEVKQTFSEFNNVVICRGRIPDILASVPVTNICFLHIDLNNALPEMAAAKHFWERVVPHGAILLDDYAYPGYDEQKVAWDHFAEDKGLQILSLPTGQGLILKPS